MRTNSKKLAEAGVSIVESFSTVDAPS